MEKLFNASPALIGITCRLLFHRVAMAYDPFSHNRHHLGMVTLRVLDLKKYPLEVVCRYRDYQLQVGKNYLYFYNFIQNIWQSNNFIGHFSCKWPRLKGK